MVFVVESEQHSIIDELLLAVATGLKVILCPFVLLIFVSSVDVLCVGKANYVERFGTRRLGYASCPCLDNMQRFDPRLPLYLSCPFDAQRL